MLTCLSGTMNGSAQVVVDAAFQGHLPAVTDLCIHGGSKSLIWSNSPEPDELGLPNPEEEEEVTSTELEEDEVIDTDSEEEEVTNTRAKWPNGAIVLRAPAH